MRSLEEGILICRKEFATFQGFCLLPVLEVAAPAATSALVPVPVLVLVIVSFCLLRHAHSPPEPTRQRYLQKPRELF